MTRYRGIWLLPALGLAALAFLGIPAYLMHMVIQILLWGLVYTAWSMMGRFGTISLGHGAFLGIGAYGATLLWNFYGVSPWIGIPLSVVLTVLVALAIGYPCFRLKVLGHYFALVTLALSEVVQRGIIAGRDVTGGSLGLTPHSVIGGSLFAFQFPNKDHFFLIALAVWLFGLWVWRRLDRSMTRVSMLASSSADHEDAAAAVGINVTREKMKVLVISASLTAFAGSMLSQYFMYINPETLSGVMVSLQMLFASITGGMYTTIGPTVGAVITIALTEFLRVLFGTQFIGGANTLYGIMLIVLVIFMPAGICGLGVRWFEGKKRC